MSYQSPEYIRFIVDPRSKDGTMLYHLPSEISREEIIAWQEDSGLEVVSIEVNTEDEARKLMKLFKKELV